MFHATLNHSTKQHYSLAKSPHGYHVEVVAVQVEGVVLVANVAFVHQYELHRLAQLHLQNVRAAAEVSLTRRILQVYETSTSK